MGADNCWVLVVELCFEIQVWNFSLVDWTLVGGFLLTRNYCGCFSREDSWRLWNLLYGLMIKLNEILIGVGGTP